MSEKETKFTSNSGCGEGTCGVTCPLTGICFNKKFLTGALVMVVWMNAFSWLWHGSVLKVRYMETASLWRSQEDMKGWAIILGVSLTALIASHIFYKGYEGKGFGEAVRFGFIISLLFSGIWFINYATQAIPEDIFYMWFLGDLISYTIGAIFLSFIFKTE